MEFHIKGKAKIERVFKTIKEHFIQPLNVDKNLTLDVFNEKLKQYVTSVYANNYHSEIQTTPNKRFFNSGDEVKYIDSDVLHKACLLELDRKVSKDCVIQLGNIDFEVPQRFSNQIVKVCYESDFSNIYVVERDKYVKIKRLNKVENSKIKRQQPIFKMED